MLTALQRAAALAAILAAGAATGALAQATTDHEAHHPEAGAAGTMPPADNEDLAPRGSGIEPGQPGAIPSEMLDGMMGPEMMGTMMGPGMMAGMAQPGTRGVMPGMPMHGHLMRVMFAIADADGDGGLSLEEIADIQRRVFSAVDADGDDRVTPEELQAFMRE